VRLIGPKTIRLGFVALKCETAQSWCSGPSLESLTRLPAEPLVIPRGFATRKESLSVLHDGTALSACPERTGSARLCAGRKGLS
jgi:hypothetical protein